MSIIDQIISIKKATSSGDLLAIIDEFILYGRLSRSSALGELGDSPILAKRLPLLTKVVEGSMYEASLYLIACDILTHLLGTLPEYLEGLPGEMTPRERQRLTIVQGNTAKVSYRELIDYNEDIHEEHIQAVYVNDYEHHSAIIIITHAHNSYDIFQGTFVPKDEDAEEEEVWGSAPEPISATRDSKRLDIDGYSTQGNNAYFFAKYYDGETIKHVMQPQSNTLLISPTPSALDENAQEFPLTQAEINKITMKIYNPKEFTKTILDIILRWEGEANA